MENADKQFSSKAKAEIEQKIKTETKSLEKVEKEHKELENAIQGYDKFYKDLEHFIIDNMQDFSVSEEDLPKYFRSNINEVYQNYVQIRKDAYDEEDELTQYINHCIREVNKNKRSLKFYKSQDEDSEFYQDCLPLINIYEKKIELYTDNQKMTREIIEKLRKIADKLKNWE